MALEGFPPAWVVMLRYLISGSIMMGVAVARGAKLPRGRELAVAVSCGLLIIGVGNGTLSWAETLIPSGLASLFITTSPFWMVGIEAAFPGGERLHLPAIAGMIVGFAGTALLLLPGVGDHQSTHAVWIGFLLLQVSVLSWSFGSIAQRRTAIAAHPFVVGAIQQLVVGIVYIPIALVGPNSQPIVWHTRPVLAVLYLAIFGGIVGYSSYVYALENLPVAITSIYSYVNCGVAVCLGWLFYREPFGWREATGMLVIFLGVAIVKWTAPGRGSRPKQPTPAYQAQSEST
jgi:drug/metabolite transporter (DMT)-like permease